MAVVFYAGNFLDRIGCRLNEPIHQNFWLGIRKPMLPDLPLEQLIPNDLICIRNSNGLIPHLAETTVRVATATTAALFALLIACSISIVNGGGKILPAPKNKKKTKSTFLWESEKRVWLSWQQCDHIGQILPLWIKVGSLRNIFLGSFSIWQNFEPTLAISLAFRQIIEVVNDQYWTNYLAIWSHWLGVRIELEERERGKRGKEGWKKRRL